MGPRRQGPLLKFIFEHCASTKYQFFVELMIEALLRVSPAPRALAEYSWELVFCSIAQAAFPIIPLTCSGGVSSYTHKLYKAIRVYLFRAYTFTGVASFCMLYICIYVYSIILYSFILHGFLDAWLARVSLTFHRFS